MLKPSKALPLISRTGQPILVYKQPILKVEQFKSILHQLNTEVEKEQYKNTAFSDGYTKYPVFRCLVDTLLAIVDLSAEDFEGEELYKLVFPHALEDGSYNRQGILAEFIIGKLSDGETNVPKEKVDYYAKLLGDLWATFGSMSEVLAIVNNVDYSSLSEIIKHRNEALKPAEQKEKEKAQKLAQAAIDRLRSSGKMAKLGKEVSLGKLM